MDVSCSAGQGVTHLDVMLHGTCVVSWLAMSPISLHFVVVRVQTYNTAWANSFNLRAIHKTQHKQRGFQSKTHVCVPCAGSPDGLGNTFQPHGHTYTHAQARALTQHTHTHIHTQIAKEEQALHCGDPGARTGNQQSYTLNTLGNLTAVPKAGETACREFT